MHAACSPVAVFDDALRALVADMVATMYAADGVGLAANQVGVSLSVFVFDCPDKDHVPHRGVVCNPVLTLPGGADRVLDEDEEGCLSLPGAYAISARPDFARVDGQDEHGQPIAFEGSGVLARCLQHETDHLNGIVFADRIPQKVRKRLYKDAEKLADEFPPGWPAE